MQDFKVGDVVLIVGDHEAPPLGGLHNKVGTVAHYDISKKTYGIEFQMSFHGGHNLGGRLDGNRGWWIAPRALVKLEPISAVMKKAVSEPD